MVAGGAGILRAQQPAQVQGLPPCPEISVKGRVVDEHGRKATQVLVKMDVDVDGAPNAYGPKGKKTLDILKHARAPHSREIVGYMTEYDGGPPTI